MLTPVTCLPDVIRNVRGLLSAIGALRSDSSPAGIEFLVGERYLREHGSPPRIVIVPEDGKLGPVLEVSAGQTASIEEGARCYVWGAEADDLDRYASAAAIQDQLVNAFKQSAPGRLVGGPLPREKGTNVVTYGEEYQLLYRYVRAVYEDPAIVAAAYASAPSPALSPPDPDRPTGDTGQTFGLAGDGANFTNERP